MVGGFLYSAFFVLIFAQVFDLSSFPSFIIPILLSLFPLSLPPCGTRMTLRRPRVAVASAGWIETWPHLPDGGPSGRNTSFSWGRAGVGMTEQNWYKTPTWSRFCSWWLHRCKEEPNSKARPSSLISVPEVKEIFLGKIQTDAYFLKVRTTVRRGDAGKGWGISHPKERCRNFQSFFTGTSYNTRQCNEFYNLFSNCPHRCIGRNQACGLRS